MELRICVDPERRAADKQSWGSGKECFMKKGLQKCVLFLLVIALICPMIPSIPVRAAGLSLAQLQNKFPNGAYWNHVVQSGHRYSNYEDIGPCNNPDGYTWTPCDTHSGVAGIRGP